MCLDEYSEDEDLIFAVLTLMCSIYSPPCDVLNVLEQSPVFFFLFPLMVLMKFLCFPASLQGGESFFRSALASMEAVYLNRNPTAKSILERVRSVDNDQICYDHLAFRTFGV